MAHYMPPAHTGPSKIVLWEPSLGRLELGNLPFVVESFQIGSPDIRDNIKNRALIDGVFDDTMYHGASAITLTTRLAPNLRCSANQADYWIATLRDTLVAYMHPRLRPRLYWRYPGERRAQASGPTIAGLGDAPFGSVPLGSSVTVLSSGSRIDDLDGIGQWAEVRGASWPFVMSGPRFPSLAVQFKNPLGQMFLGDPEDPPLTATAEPGAVAEGRSYDLTFDRSYPDVAHPVGTAVIHNGGNSYAGFRMQVHGPFDAGATLNMRGVSVEFNEALLINQYVELRTLNKTILRETGNSYYPFTNFGDWDWDDLLLPHGDTFMTFDGVDSGAPSGWATIEWHSTSI